MPSGRSKAARKQQSHTMLTLDITKSDISWEEMGVLSQMLNIPECDYVTPEQLARYSTDPPSSVKKLLDALVKKEFRPEHGRDILHQQVPHQGYAAH